MMERTNRPGIQIPSKLKALLSQDERQYAVVMLSLAEFEPWFKMSGTPFFPEYTGHGLEHVEDVLRTSDALISDDARDVLTPGDAAALTLATLLHDCAMHLTEDGFVDLVSPNGDRPTIQGFEDKPWPMAWDDFVAEARRWDGRKLTSVFGSTDPIRRPELDPQKLTQQDRLLIGEFLRRHHARLAHEIALHGVPGPSNDRLSLKEVAKDLDLGPVTSVSGRQRPPRGPREAGNVGLKRAFLRVFGQS